MTDHDRYREHLKDEFINIYNKPYTGDEYFKVAVSTYYTNYDYVEKGIISKISIPITRMKTETISVRGVLKSQTKQVTQNEKIGVWAVKKADGIHEMVTGMKIYPIAALNHLCCYGIEPIKNEDAVRIVQDIQLLDSNINYKNQFITELNKYTSDAWKEYFEREKHKEKERQAPIIKAQREAEAFQFLKTYKLPGTN